MNNEYEYWSFLRLEDSRNPRRCEKTNLHIDIDLETVNRSSLVLYHRLRSDGERTPLGATLQE
jgi:hypothetical protein